MQIAIVLFDHFTGLDAVGPYEVLSRLPGAEVVFVGQRIGPVRTDVDSLALHADATWDEVPAPDVIVVPGGYGQTAHMSDGQLHHWLRAADRHSTWTTSVCTGSLILAAAGLLRGRRATTHWLAHDELPALGAVAVPDRVVFDGKYVTAAGVSAGLDMALALVGRIAGDSTAQLVQLGLEYDPQPPYSAGSTTTAPAETIAMATALKDHILLGQ